MRDKKKMNLFLGIGFTVFIVFLVGLCFLSVRVMNSKKQIVLPETTQTTTNETTQSEQTTSSMKEITENSELEEFLETYFTWELTEESVSDRAIKLENMMSATCYDLTEIQSDKEQLTKMIQKYDKTKEINTSNSMQLVSSNYLSSQIYQDTKDSSSYYAKVKTEQKAPYQESAFPMQEDVRITLRNGKITQIKTLNSSQRSEQYGSEKESK